ncbi:MAG TPA: hypothetical protein VFL91_24755 [Thermomicrobiales bacterium]|nr:hypothetical protein [Thermomicrobiales bacterium]
MSERGATPMARRPPPRRFARALRRLAGGEAARLALLLAVAAAIRCALLLTPGYDVRDYRLWASVVARTGIGGAYGAAYPPPAPWYNYPPAYLYVLRVAGLLYQTLRPDGAWQDHLLTALLKLAPILAELALGGFLYWVARRHRGARVAIWTAAAYLLSPGLIWDTAYWGGIDALHALCLTVALVAAAARRPVVSWPLAALAIGAKLLAAPGALATLPGPLRARRWPRLALAAGVAFAAGLLLSLPVLLRGRFLLMVRLMFSNLGNSALISANAHNLWWLVTGGDGWRPDTLRVLPGLTYRDAGLALFALGSAWTLWQLWRSPNDLADVCLAGAFLTLAFCLLTTEVHENWGYALFAPLALGAALRPRYRPLYALLSLTFLANLALHDPALRRLADPGFDRPALLLSLANAALNLLAFAWWAALLAREPARRAALLSEARPVAAPGSLLRH